MHKSEKPVAVDLFCGCGGLTFGMRKAGINVLAGIDSDPKLKETYEMNNPGSVYILKDIRNVTGTDIERIFKGHKGPKILAGCAPCQPFSKMNKKKSKLHKDYSLLLEFGRLIREVRPDGVIMENVPQLSDRGHKVFDKFLKTLQEVGLAETHEPSLDFASDGVPQHRKRLVLIAARNRPRLPRLIYGPNCTKNFRTVEWAIRKYPIIKQGHSESTKRNHSCRSLSELNLERIALTPHNGGSRKDIPKLFWIRTHKAHRGHDDTYGRMKWTDPAPTLTCKCLSVTNGRFAHPEQDRGISVREAAALQSFPDRYSFPLNLQVAQRCIGNAVPPLIAKKISRSLLKYIS